MKRLERDFFIHDSVLVAKNLIGKGLFFNNKKGTIIETEAYKGGTDPASHACKG
jgi:3-methyladenine DNA glycosylase Mpg